MSSNTAVPPPVSWAQRHNLLYVIVNVECKDVEYKFTEDSMYFKGTSIQGNKLHEVTLNFLHKINPDKVTSKNISRCLEFTIYKVESGPYWPTLTTDKKKPHFLKVDFNKWVDEGSDEEIDQSDLFGDLGRLHEGGEKPAMDDLFPNEYDEEEDSDDDEIPPLVSDNRG